MATYTIDGLIAKIDGYLDKVAEEARTYMSGYITDHAKEGYATGALAASINVEKPSENIRSVGSSLRSERSGHVYGNYVDQGRGEVHAKSAPYLRYFDKKKGHWVRTKVAGPMTGINFVEATKNHLETTKIPL